MNTILAIGFGGGIGSVARYLTMIGCGQLCGTSFPWGTLGRAADHRLPRRLRPLIAIGGGLTLMRALT